MARIINHRISITNLDDNDRNRVLKLELDSHADSPVVGNGAHVIEYTGKQVSVSGFTDELGKPMLVDVVHAVITYDCPKTGSSYPMLINNAILVPSVDCCLINPFMLRLAGVEVDECPKFLSPTPSIINHSLYFPEIDLRLPLMLDGIVSYLSCRTPNRSEYEDCESFLQLTPLVETWDPHLSVYNDQEVSMMDHEGKIKESGNKQFIVSKILSRTSDPITFAHDVMKSVHANQFSAHQIKSVKSLNGIDAGIDPAELAKIWNIGMETAKRTIQATTRMCPRNTTTISLNRRYGSNDRMIRYKHLNCVMFADTMFASSRVGKSVRNFTCCQVFATDFGWSIAYNMEYERNVHQAFKKLFKEVGVPLKMIVDGARSQTMGETNKLCESVGCQIVELEKNTPASNRAERTIQELKMETKRDMKLSGSPLVFWCYCIERRSEIMSCCAKNNPNLDGMVPRSMMLGEVSDISHICNFQWYEWVKFRRVGPEAAYPYPSEHLGRCLGPARNKGNAMSQHVLLMNGKIIPVQTLRSLTTAELDSELEQRKRKEFDDAILKLYGDYRSVPPTWVKRRRKDDDQEQYIDVEEDEEGIDPSFGNGQRLDQTTHAMPEVDSIPDFDAYVHAEVMLPNDEGVMQMANVLGQSTNNDGDPIGEYDDNPMLNTRVYDVIFPDGVVHQYSANIIAQNIYEATDEDGFRYQLLEEIIDHKKTPEAVSYADANVPVDKSQKKIKLTSKGWEIHVQWKDGQRSWVPMIDVKESYPVELAEYARMKGIADEPAFAWWIPYTLKKRDQIISAVNRRVKKKTHKYGLEVPRTVEGAYLLDQKNKNTYWRDAIKKEMRNVVVAFNILDSGENVPGGYGRLGIHMVFDVKLDLTRKARLVADGHLTPDPIDSTYAGVVSRESVRIALTYAALLDLDLWAADIMNAFVQAPTTEKYYVECGPEFGNENKGKRAIVIRALYGMKSSGRDFRNHLRDCMDHMGYKSCLADPDLWMRQTKLDNGTEYYEYILLYVDDCLVISEHPDQALKKLGKYFPMKPESVGPPKLYLGGKLSKVDLPNGVKAWAISASKYIHNALKNVEATLSQHGLSLRRGTNSPLPGSYRPECDVTPECDTHNASLYASLIGILRWLVELGRIDITCEVSMMSSHTAMPREGHLAHVLYIFSYLKQHHNSRLVLDPTYPDIDMTAFQRYNWKQFYGDVKELLPSNAPRAIGKEFIIRAFVDADFAGDSLTRRSRTGFVVFINSAPIFWLSKKQSSLETSSFGSEFVAMRQCCEYLRGLRYKLRMMGIPVDNPCFIFGDNQSVLWNTTIPDSMLKKKTGSVSYHFVRERVSADEWRTTYVNTKANPSDILTKNLPAGENRYNKVRMVLYDIHPINDDIERETNI